MKAEFCYVVFNLDLEMRYIFTGSSGIQDEVKQWSKFLELRWPASSDHCTADPEILNLVDGYRCHIHITLIYTLNKPGFWPHQCHYTVPGAGKRLLYLEISKWIHICFNMHLNRGAVQFSYTDFLTGCRKCRLNCTQPPSHSVPSTFYFSIWLVFV